MNKELKEVVDSYLELLKINTKRARDLRELYHFDDDPEIMEYINKNQIR